jgi:outer membrane protein assembly factor BamB
VRRLFLLVPWLLLAPDAWAQEEDVGQPFWVSTPPGATAALNQARAALAARDWTGAAKALDTVFRHYPEAFTRMGKSDIFRGARGLAVELLAAAPEELRGQYEDRYGAEGERKLRQALAIGDRKALVAVVRQYEATRAGLRAILALADDALLRGRPAEARLLLARIPVLHAAARDDPAVRRRRVLAAARDHAEGGPAPREGEAGDIGFPARHPDAWPILGGNAARNREVSGPLFHDLRYVIGVNIDQRPWDRPPRPSSAYTWPRRRQRSDYDWDERWQSYNPTHPVIARGVLLHHDGRQVVAHNLYTHERLWRYPPRADFDREGRTNLQNVFTPVVADGVVYAAVEVPVAYRPQTLQNVPIIYYLPARRLVALDLETGEVLWRHDDDWFERHEGQEPLKQLTITGAPVVRGDRLYVGACYSEGTFRNFLVAIDRRTGELVYRTRISYGQQELNLFGRQLQECSPTPVTEADGVLYYSTNLGVFSAVDALLGSPLWATAYPIVEIPSTYYWFEAPRRWPQFDNGPPLVTDNLVVAAPPDATGILLLDRRTGSIRRRLPATIWLPDLKLKVRTLHGMDGERAFVSGEGGIAAIWLVEDKERRIAPGDVAWHSTFPDGDESVGRGLVADNGLWVPTYDAIYRVDTRTGKLLDRFLRDPNDDDEDDTGPVNLVWGDGVLLTASREFIGARFAEGNIIELARQRIRERPAEVGPVLGAADVHLAAGQLSQAIRYYKEALLRAGAQGARAAESRARSGLHRALLRRAENVLEKDPGQAQPKFEEAFRAAPTDLSRLAARRALERTLAERHRVGTSKWRLANLQAIEKDHGDAILDETGRRARGWALRRVAEIHIEDEQVRKALAVLQQLLENDPDGVDGRYANRRIRRLLDDKGRREYEAYDRRALKLFKTAQAAGDLEALERGLRIYANARAAEAAGLELARRRLERGDAAAAVSVLQRFLVERPASKRVPEALVLMVLALHQHRSYGPAYAALLRLRTRHGDELVPRRDGARVPARELAEEWLATDPYRTLARSARRLHLEPNLELRFTKSFPNFDFVEIPELLGQRPEFLGDVVILRTGLHARLLDAATGDERYRMAFGSSEPQGPLVFAGTRLYAVTHRLIHVFDAKTGKLLHRPDVPDGGIAERLLEHQGQLFLLYHERLRRGRLGIAALHPEDGTVLWSRFLGSGMRRRASHTYHAVAHADRLLVVTSRPVAVTVLDPTSGAVENRIVVEDAPGTSIPVPPIVLPDGRLLLGVVTRKAAMPRFEHLYTYAVSLVDPGSRPEGAVLWTYRPRRDGENRHLQHLNATAAYVAAVDDARGFAVFDLQTGAEIKWEPRLAVGGAQDQHRYIDNSQPRHDSLLLVLMRSSLSEDPALLTAYELPDLRAKYTVKLTEDGRETARLIEAHGVLGVYVVPRRPNLAPRRVRLFDPMGGIELQQLQPPTGKANWITVKVQNGILMVTTQNAVYAYGPGPK